MMKMLVQAIDAQIILLLVARVKRLKEREEFRASLESLEGWELAMDETEAGQLFLSWFKNSADRVDSDSGPMGLGLE